MGFFRQDFNGGGGGVGSIFVYKKKKVETGVLTRLGKSRLNAKAESGKCVFTAIRIRPPVRAHKFYKSKLK